MGAPEWLGADDKSRTDIAPAERQLPAGGDVRSDAPVPISRRLGVQRSFSGPLPAPGILAHYDEVVPGLAREIVDQWKGETRHRHLTVTGLHELDMEELSRYYEAERRGQVLAFLSILGVLLIAVVAIVLDRPAVGVAGLLTGGAAAIWAMRRRSDGADGDPPAQGGDATPAVDGS